MSAIALWSRIGHFAQIAVVIDKRTMILDDNKDDASTWTNYSSNAHPAEIKRMEQLVSDPVKAAAYLAFGLRPFGPMDHDPYDQPIGLHAPWAPNEGDFCLEPLLVDTSTGWRFRVEAGGPPFTLDLQSSNNFIEAQELLARAAASKSSFDFTLYDIPAFHNLGAATGSALSFPVARPINLHASSRGELQRHIDDLGNLFCGQLPVKRLWFRGQCQEYPLVRDAHISQQLYGRSLPSLTPSIERYARKHPDKMNHGFAVAGPNHWWKKPFMIWLMRQNSHWFDHDDRFMPLLERILTDDDDRCFVELMMKIQMSPIEIGSPPHLNWPDEADDLRQWFFLHMKKRSFAVTLQQYGYCTSLLDLTEDLEVALYFSQASMNADRLIRCAPPKLGRVIYVFAESYGGFYRHGSDLFWGTDGWLCQQPPRLDRQKAGFIQGATNRTQNFYGMMIIARIELGPSEPVTNLSDTDLFPSEPDDLLLETLRASRPAVEGLY